MTMRKLVYVTLTGNCRRFAKKVNQVIGETVSYELGLQDDSQFDDEFIIVVPSYEPTTKVKLADEFLSKYSHLCKGIVGSGNRNFAQLYCYTAIYLSEKYHIPMVHDFEFAGLQADVDRVASFL